MAVEIFKVPDAGSAFSQAESLSDKININSAKNVISSGVDKLSGTVKGLFGKSPVATVETQMPKGLPRIPSSTETTPPPIKSTAPIGSLTYPTDIKYFAMFKFMQYERVLATDPTKLKPRAAIILPMPSNLSETFSMDYDKNALGPVAGAVDAAITNKLRELQGAGPAQGQQQGNATIGGVAGALAPVMVTGMINKVREALGGKGGSVAGDIIRKATGLTPNPYLAVIFRNVQLRSHQFSYRFAPNSLKELETVKNIIKQFKTSMLPGFLKGSADMSFTFPDTCEITFGPNKHVPYLIKRCVLQDMTVNYSPNGPAFFKTGDPVIVDISLTFQEIQPYTRKDEGIENETVDKESLKRAQEAGLIPQPPSVGKEPFNPPSAIDPI